MPERVTVELLKAFLDAFNRHDLDDIMSYFADECVFYMPRGEGPRGDRFVGKAAVRAGLAQRRGSGYPGARCGPARVLRRQDHSQGLVLEDRAVIHLVR